MDEIVKARIAMVAIVAAAVAWAIAQLAGAVAYAVLSRSGLTAFTALIRTSYWLHVVAGAFLLAAVVSVIWPLVLRQAWIALPEVIGAAVASLLIFIGALVDAAGLLAHSQNGCVVYAIGVGIWGLLLLARAARRSLEEQKTGTKSRQPTLWLAAAVALVLLAVQVGLLGSDSIHDKGMGIAIRVIETLGLSLLALTLMAARHLGLLTSRRVQLAVVGIWILALAAAGAVIVAAVVYQPDPSLLGIRTGLALVGGIAAVGGGFLAWSAWTQLVYLTTTPPSSPRGEGLGACGHRVPPGAQYCPSCGARVSA